MTDDELAELEKRLIAKMNQITELQQEATDMTLCIIAEHEERRSPASVHELRREQLGNATETPAEGDLAPIVNERGKILPEDQDLDGRA